MSAAQTRIRRREDYNFSCDKLIHMRFLMDFDLGCEAWFRVTLNNRDRV